MLLLSFVVTLCLTACRSSVNERPTATGYNPPPPSSRGSARKPDGGPDAVGSKARPVAVALRKAARRSAAGPTRTSGARPAAASRPVARHAKAGRVQASVVKRIPWRTLQPGVEYAKLYLVPPVPVGEHRFHIVRIDPSRAPLVASLASRHGRRNRTARSWMKRHGLAVAINAGMFKKDYLSNVGYLRYRGHLNSRKWNRRYLSVLAFDPRGGRGRRATIFDMDRKGAWSRLRKYRSVVQNLRLIKQNPKTGRGVSVWSMGRKRWSEAALALDRKGRLLFLFTRTPYTMWEFNWVVLQLPLGVIRAMHLEGGPEASLSIRAGGIDLHLCGSYETGFRNRDDNSRQWRIPNVIGVKKSR